MKKILIMLAVTTLLVSPIGCGACRNRLKPKQQAAAVSVPMCAPVAQCAPACGGCGACGSGAAVTYGYDSEPTMVAPTMP
ncbi:MAG: hypothetical protein ABGX16_08350 [Pirellulales bacterium]